MMNTSSVASKSSKSFAFARIVRGAAMVEYALLLVAILLLAGSAYKTLGKKTAQSVRHSSQVL